MIDRLRRRAGAALASVVVAVAVMLPAAAQSPLPVTPAATSTAASKKVVRSADDLPRFTYPIDGSASALLQSDAATFNAFAARVKTDIDGVLDAYDIQDHATLRGLLNTELAIDVLAGTSQAGAQPLIDRIRSLEDKPDAKALSGLRTQAMLSARADARAASGPAYLAAFRKRYGTAIDPLPWHVVGTALKETKSELEIVTPALLLGQVQGSIDPAVAKTHALGNDTAAALISLRFLADEVIPLKAPTLAVLDPLVARNARQKPDIWQARDVTLPPSPRLTPVNVGIWDGGTDISLFPHQVFTDPSSSTNPHGFAFDLYSRPTTGVLYPLPLGKKALFPQFVRYFEGISDLQSSIDSPAATALKKKLATMAPNDVAPFFENLDLFSGTYSHGTHVGGLAVRGNSAARIVVGRITYDYKTIPTPPTTAIMRQTAASEIAAVRYFRAHHVRVVNMSWGDNPSAIENVLEKNGIGKDASDRKVLARSYFLIERNALYGALKSAPEILFVCAAGNDDADASFSESIPSGFDLPNLLVVGAVDQAGDETSFTSYGKTVAVDADGYHVPSYVPGGAIVKLSGTSMASPNTANLAAKLFAIDAKLTPVQAIALIRKGATPSPDGRRHLIDPKASVALLRAMLRETAQR